MKSKDFPGWPTGDNKPIVEIRFTSKDLKSRNGLEFCREKDDLDWYLGAYYIDAEIGPIVLMAHENSPATGTIIYIDSKAEEKNAFAKTEKRLKLTEKDILWKSF